MSEGTPAAPTSTPRLVGPVEVIGTGLLGTSIGLACRRAGLEVLLTDVLPEHVRTASGLGAGRPKQPGDQPQVVVVAVPPDHLGQVIGDVLTATAGTDTVVTDIGSVKSGPLTAVASHPEVARYVGSHPMAGSERSGPLAGHEALFEGRPWAITPHLDADVEAVETVEELVKATGAVPVWLTPHEHDRAVARTSHVPHLMAALTAGRLATAPPNHLALSGQGVRDVTRVAEGEPTLYGQIVSANSEAVLDLLGEVRHQLDQVIAAIRTGDRATLEGVLALGAAGTRAIPGKHGRPARPMQSVWVSVPDTAGQLAKLFADAVESSVNVEDIRIDHDPTRPVGLVELVVDAEQADHLLDSLESRGWTTHR
ncbi:prephenate dehydrogenase [Nocardioides daphniae]|uniref:Prephenate dehydrogenase n=1 Tax=Nocardioides daphniae TaxID=402297 RepID=A0A4P7UB45_9ACTN|nr:prephenate dehydrogenase [Nocardioides daphniae]QCC77176.1 prephenate dehydrogenase [Nocardioides daphniae]GGD27125.1 prephenate dehydrogenase [Nocardioides daphniae]